MPIVTRDNIKCLHFGYGDIFVGDIQDDNGRTEGVAFILSQPREIGSEWEESKGQTLDSFDTHVVMKFDDIKSLDVVIQVLEATRNSMRLQRNAY
ncbi:hypothetical protein [Paenibacillus cremeus]|uniref:Uncharacterized protein n=1 Tax=Paenibacillus cremeus TaxID=2163881 RepID=A0A559KCM1_9BACL|nr:hypothetical protein [Paenibacillus cremeus]TVY09878.1 hypothetical protein FPZ49_10930 [Paenibacillus cremeus]